MKYLLPLLLLFACKKEQTITFKLVKGQSDVFCQQGWLVTDFQQCPEGWKWTVPSKHQTYKIQATGIVAIYRNGCMVAYGKNVAQFENP